MPSSSLSLYISGDVSVELLYFFEFRTCKLLRNCRIVVPFYDESGKDGNIKDGWMRI